MNITKSLQFLVFILPFVCFAQNGGPNYAPKNADSLNAYVNTITQKKVRSFTAHQKEIQKLLDERKEDFLKEIRDSAYIFEPAINNYLKGMLGRIYSANPEIDERDFYFFIDKSPVPNAACYGNGIFTVNLGLFDLVKSDDELAFILCHEIAHYHLKHNDKSLINFVQTLNSKDTKRKLNKAKSKRYGRRQAISDVVKNLTYNFQRRSRSAEMQADSLGLVFMARSGYKRSASAESLKRLDNSDTLLFTTNTQIKKHFHFADYPFKEAWLTPDETLFDIDEKADDLALDKDSLRTHPDMPERIEKLQTQYAEAENSAMSAGLAKVKQLAAEYTIIASMHDARLDMALYQVLSLAENNAIEKSAYNNTVAGLLKKTYELKASHKFGKYVAQVSPFSDEKYLNEVRLFLHHLELKNIRKIGLQFCLSHEAEMAGNPEFEKLTAYFKSLNP